MAGQRGFTYIGLLFAIAFLALLTASAGEVWKSAAQREREEDLLFFGREFARAIAAYHAATPGQTKQYPLHLDDLLEDRRGPIVLRHLRKVYADPMTGRADWGLIKAGEAIVGVHSMSEGKPRKQANFAEGEDGFAGAMNYRGWRFMAESSQPK
ncbi:MAG: type II secretion system protein [Rhodocyclales bacterium]|nr:type II secretion system protein [Rhodocyclales bacterium]MBI5786229.1 type II secretion system protein [Rhodocyclales bacterium]